MNDNLKHCGENEKVGLEEVTEMKMKRRVYKGRGLDKRRSVEVREKENNVKNNTSARCITHPLKANAGQYFPSCII